MADKIVLSANATPEEIAAAKTAVKKQYGESAEIYVYEVDGKKCYLRSMDRNTYALAAAKVSSAGPAKFNDIVIENIWLGGDEDLRKVDQYFFGLVDLIEDFMAKKKGTLVTL